MRGQPHTPGCYRLIEYRMGRKRKGRATRPAHPFIHLPRRSGRPPALPYPPGRLVHFSSLKVNRILKIWMREDKGTEPVFEELGNFKNN
jgi:hypothetical protein